MTDKPYADGPFMCCLLQGEGKDKQFDHINAAIIYARGIVRKGMERGKAAIVDIWTLDGTAPKIGSLYERRGVRIAQIKHDALDRIWTDVAYPHGLLVL